MDDFPRGRDTDEDLHIKRTVHQQRSYLAPTADQAQMMLYCFALATTSNKQIPCALMTTLNQLDVVITDTCGERSDYTQLCHGLAARGRNSQLRRKDTFWSCGAPDECVLLSPEHTIEHLLELLCGPIEQGLVKELRHWDGAKLLPSAWGVEQSVARPAAFNTPRTTLPARIEFTPQPPLTLVEAYGLEGSKELVTERLEERIDEIKRERGGKTFVGRRRCSQLNPLKKHGDPEPPPKMPHFAGSNKQVVDAMKELKRRRKFYAQCRETFRKPNGKGVVFGAGTVMFRKLGAFCDPLPASRAKVPPFKHHALPPPEPTK